jgi:DNA-binding NarL/FixJ family response regulator
MPRVLIVDDHPIVRIGGVRAMLEPAPGFEVCGEAGSTAEALRLLSAENPDVTLLDLMLGGRGGADFVTECLRACPRTRISMGPASPGTGRPPTTHFRRPATMAS